MRYGGFEDWWRAQRRRRPWWMNGLMYFCIFMAAVALPLDLFHTPVAHDDQTDYAASQANRCRRAKNRLASGAGHEQALSAS